MEIVNLKFVGILEKNTATTNQIWSQFYECFGIHFSHSQLTNGTNLQNLENEIGVLLEMSIYMYFENTDWMAVAFIDIEYM